MLLITLKWLKLTYIFLTLQFHVQDIIFLIKYTNNL
jgi:hypothetical protein